MLLHCKAFRAFIALSGQFTLFALKGVVPKRRFYFAGSSEMFGRVAEIPQTKTTRFRPLGLRDQQGRRVRSHAQLSRDGNSCVMPHVDGVSGAAGLRNGSYPMYVYLSHVWYHLAIILNDSNGQQHDHQPIDWGHTFGFVLDMGTLGPNTYDGALLSMFIGKAVQIMNNGFGPQLDTKVGTH
jgi:hypothetical protein